MLVVAFARVLAVLSVLSAVSCGARTDPPQSLSKNGRELTAALSRLNLANPAADVDQALTHGDRRFVGVCGFACVAPGVDSSGQAAPAATDLRIIAGTSDVMVQGEESLQQTAADYARTYNSILLERLAK